MQACQRSEDSVRASCAHNRLQCAGDAAWLLVTTLHGCMAAWLLVTALHVCMAAWLLVTQGLRSPRSPRSLRVPAWSAHQELAPARLTTMRAAVPQCPAAAKKATEHAMFCCRTCWTQAEHQNVNTGVACGTRSTAPLLAIAGPCVPPYETSVISHIASCCEWSTYAALASFPVEHHP